MDIILSNLKLQLKYKSYHYQQIHSNNSRLNIFCFFNLISYHQHYSLIHRLINHLIYQCISINHYIQLHIHQYIHWQCMALLLKLLNNLINRLYEQQHFHLEYQFHNSYNLLNNNYQLDLSIMYQFFIMKHIYQRIISYYYSLKQFIRIQ